ncbi:MAG TPA: NADH-quinone oxidoreductase subunit J [Coxiellaceae bacterium]|nr:MAG: NADH:ubiquinone oxidoreductase subunit J [Gammaproteobacteria bacterium RIFCSPHIGHO2_12_FULL_36_30]HLB56614.1 NADH-quinone oxidoreductase subunit J [Coxiellaceae bacterium]
MIPIHEIIFYIFTVLVIATATMVITAKNPVKAVLCLVLAFFASSVLWMLMQAEFLALVLIFVYVGAVMTLFLFVVMMLRTDPDHSKIKLRHYLSGFIAFVILVGTALYVFCAKNWSASSTLPIHYAADYNNVQAMGVLLFTRFIYPFEIAAVLLLVGMIAAIALAFNGRKPGTKSQIISQQLKANKKDRLRVIDLRGDRS